jgi:signal transduction histidine kinase/putative methionine-R-sulfoxide reductase with GAF domain
MSVESSLAAARRQLAALRDVATAVSSQLELEPLLQAIVDAVCTVLGSERASLFLLDEATGEVVSRVLTGQASEIRVGPGKGIVGAVLSSGQALRVDDAWSDPRFHRSTDEGTGFRTRNILAVPLRSHDGALKGVVQALNKAGGPFDDDDAQLLAAMGAELAVALERARLFDELRRKKAEADRRVQELDLLVEIDRALLGVDGVQALLDVVVDRTAALLPAEAASVAVMPTNRHELVFRAAAGPDKGALIGQVMPLHTSLVGKAFSRRDSVRLVDAENEASDSLLPSASSGFVPGPVLVSPLLLPRGDGNVHDVAADGDRALGVIMATRARGAPAFSASDERLLELIASRVAFALDVEQQKERARTRDQLESMGRMLAGIVHDFRTPMTVISGYVQLMAAADDASERQGCAEQVLKGTEQMSEMIKQLLAFARGDSEVLLRKAWAENVARDATEMLGRLLVDSGIEFVVDVRSRSMVRVDDLKLKRALANLVKNAREALESAPPKAPASPRIVLSVVDDGDSVAFGIGDNGPGLPQAMLGRLFEEFATYGKANGTGLGLALVKRIADEHEGTVAVDNHPGEGVTFALRLPRA